MADKEREIRDDEFRVLGQHTAESSITGEAKSRRKGRIAIVLAVLCIVLGLLAILFWPKPETENPYDGVYENNVEETILVEEICQLGCHADTEESFTEKVDTVINDVRLVLYIPHNATPELMVGRPNPTDKDIILIAQAADIRADNKKILGAFVLKGEPLAWGLSKKGYCGIIDGQMTVGTSENSPLFEEATEKGGYFFRQFSLVDNGKLVENEVKNKSIRKALCSRAGQHFIAVTETDESYHDFAQALVDLGVENAVSLVGSQYAYGWAVNADGSQEIFAEDIHKYKNENYLLWRRNE